MKKAPDCSVLIPCHNGEKHLTRLFETLKNQTTPFTELLLFDDCSSDNSAELARSWGATVILSKRSTPSGPAYARNELLKVARGQWVHFHDVDDILEPNFVEDIFSTTSEGLEVITCFTDWIDEEENSVQVARRYDQAQLQNDTVRSVVSNPLGVVSTVIRTVAARGVGGFDEELRCWEDGDFFVRLAASGSRFHVVEKLLAYSVRHGEGISANQSYCTQCRMKLLKEYGEIYQEIPKEILVSELEKVAAQFITQKDFGGCKEAIRLAHYYGGKLPRTESPLLRVLSKIFPAHLAFALQQFVRKN